MRVSWLNRMSRVSRVMIATASLLLVPVYFFPLWKIQLWAPQYPEGLSLSIWASKLTGDITTVNILNHYIGMAPIAEANFPELKMFPIAFAALIGLGFVAILIGRRFAAVGWAAGILSFSLWALYDFYQWEYRFGHDLNPDAAIKMDDMVYQPPLIGEKIFLNITATSWPEFAGYTFSFACVLALFVMASEVLKKRPLHGDG